jgi:hypothetical protein
MVSLAPLTVRCKNAMKISSALNGLLLSSRNCSMTFVFSPTPCHHLADYKVERQMSILVEQQDETINIIEAQAVEVEKDVETG